MKKQLLSVVLIGLVSALASCENISSSSSVSAASSSGSAGFEKFTCSTDLIYQNSGKIHLVDSKGALLPDSSGSIAPFDTSISMTYYRDKDAARDTAFENDFSYSFQRYHALFDRHHYYGEDIDGVLTKINNIADLNDAYGSGQAVVLDPELYASLKKSYNYSLISQDKFSIAIGNLSTLWDYYISGSLEYDGAAASYAQDSYNDMRSYFIDPSSELVDLALKTTPTTEELKTMLTFDDETHSILFNAVKRIDDYIVSTAEIQKLVQTWKANGLDFSKPSLTLGGYGKGEATELFADRYKDEGHCFLINSGGSSVKCVGNKPDGTPWDLSVASPFYNEAIRVASFDNLNLNYADLILRKAGSFNLSTSGYYNNYYYVKQSDGTSVLRSHILNQDTGYSVNYFASASVLMDDSGYADMYTTSLMNCGSLIEASALLEHLNAALNLTAVPYYLIDSENKDLTGKKTVCRCDSSLYSYFYQSKTLYPTYFTHNSITTVESI